MDFKHFIADTLINDDNKLRYEVLDQDIVFHVTPQTVRL